MAKPAPRRAQTGVTLMELLTVVTIIGILAGIAYPAYQKSVTKTRRRAAEACVSEYAGFMERYYTANLRYVDDMGNPPALPALDCASASSTGPYYSYGYSGTPSASTYTLKATPQGKQSTNDAQCGALTLTETGQRGVTGTAGTASCW